ncbi:MAG: ATP-binding protein [Muribaculaceae bacterium]|nr:ATP-binding protein [Muribaculaceae bacterium]
MESAANYAIGQQDFKVLREGGALYIDKTFFIEKIVRSQSMYYFLARPRRFGKSLFLSALRYFFEGRRDLFKGLHIDTADWDWQPYPVLYIDLNTDRYAGPGMLDGVLDRLFREWEEKYDVNVMDEGYSQRFATIIKAAHEKTGRRVVILVDEYDKPLVGNLNNDASFEHYRERLSSLYSNFKSSAEHIRLVFLTGVSRFSKLSVFSDLNNINDITFSNDYADICGITEKELLDNFKPGIERLAAKREVDYQEACEMLKKNYDGYRFAIEGSDIYNPWSVLNCLDKLFIDDYWNATGAATVIAQALYSADVDIEETLNAQWNFRDLSGLDLRNANPTALLYQTGYLTIADYDPATNRVRLKVPNEEVKKGLFNNLLPCYVKVKRGDVNKLVSDIIFAIYDGRPEVMMRSLQTYFDGIPYDLKIENENNFQNAFFILMTLIGVNAKAEVHTSDGRIDLLIETPKFIYIIELKYDSSPDEALCQIEEKQYERKFSSEQRKIFKIGVSFSSVTRRIEGWKEGRAGRVENTEKSLNEEKYKIARNLVALGLSYEDIANATGLSKEEVSSLRLSST